MAPPIKPRAPWWIRLPGWILYPAVILSLGCCIIVLPCSVTIRDGEGWIRSAASLQRIGLALQNYHEVNGHLPPAVVTSKDGKPLYSWRVTLLPYFEEMSLYKQFKQDEAWDSPHNRRLAETTPRCYQPALGGDDPPGLTRYQVLVGPGTAFERPGLSWADFPKGRAKTLLVVEAKDPVPWSKPADLVYEPDKPVPRMNGPFGKPVHFLCYEVWKRPGFNACFADSTTRFIHDKTDEKTLRRLITRDAEEVDLSKAE
jgi:hypothetical protein